MFLEEGQEGLVEEQVDPEHVQGPFYLVLGGEATVKEPLDGQQQVPSDPLVDFFRRGLFPRTLHSLGDALHLAEETVVQGRRETVQVQVDAGWTVQEGHFTECADTLRVFLYASRVHAMGILWFSFGRVDVKFVSVW